MDNAIKYMCIWPLAWHNKNKPYVSSTLLQQFLTLLFTSHREREAMKDERTYHGAMDKSWSEQQICVSASIFCIVRKNWPYPPTASRCYGRKEGWQMKYSWILKTLKFSTGITIQTFCAMLLQCWNCISVSFCQAKLILRRVLKCEKFGCHFFHINPYC